MFIYAYHIIFKLVSYKYLLYYTQYSINSNATHLNQLNHNYTPANLISLAYLQKQQQLATKITQFYNLYQTDLQLINLI